MTYKVRSVAGKQVKYSPCDHDLMESLTLRLKPKDCGLYVMARPRKMQGRGGWRALHRIVLGLPRFSPQVDHKNGDGLDNRRENLRVCTNGQNQANRGKQNKAGLTSKFKGVRFENDKERKKPWRASVRVDGVRHRGPRRATELQAAVDYDLLAKKHFGEFARLNFEEVPDPSDGDPLF